MNTEEIIQIVNNLSYKDGWSFIIGKDITSGKNFIQVVCEVGVCSVSKKPSNWRGRKNYVSDFACKQEVVGIYFSLVKDAEIHEAHEWFRYKGASIYNPHLDPDALLEVAKLKRNFITRPDSMTNT